MGPSVEAWSVLGQFAWPITALIVFFVLRKELTALLLAITDRMEQATEVVIAGNVTLKVPESGHPITAEHLPLLHSTFRYPRKDAEYGQKVFVLHAVIKADPRVLRRIEWVEYHLTDDWPNPTHRVQTAADRFKLKELTWGEFLLRARVKVRDQDTPIEVSRFVNLMMKGPKI